VATTVAPQALLLMNSKLMTGQSRALASRLLRRSKLTDRQRLQRVFELVYSRLPTSGEITQLLAFLVGYERKVKNGKPSIIDARLQAWQALCRVLLSSHEFVYVE
ncbi:MAG: DUF1553 domain-containing protein, partial [Planctomycetes bacterium]|nr:DUF1553 domain-containing protein [Planctomycetota bacterium]